MPTCCTTNLANSRLVSLKMPPFDDEISTIYSSEYDSKFPSHNHVESDKSSKECNKIYQNRNCGSDLFIPYHQSHQDAFPLISSLKHSLTLPIKRKEIQLQKIRENRYCSSWRDLIHGVIDHFVFRTVFIWLIIIDSILIIIDLSLPTEIHHQHQYLDIVAFVFSIIFFVEMTLRIYSIGKHQFFSDWFAWVDLMITLLSLPINYVCMMSHLARFERLIIIIRLVPLARLFEIVREIVDEFQLRRK